MSKSVYIVPVEDMEMLRSLLRGTRDRMIGDHKFIGYTGGIVRGNVDKALKITEKYE